MEASRLRLLARRHANGEFDEDEYLRQRADLIDAITCGEVPIERGPEHAGEEPAATGPGSGSGGSERPYSPLHLLVGVAVVVAVA